MRVLVVEDQHRLGQFLLQGLSECNYTVNWVKNCAQATDALAESAFEVVVLDLGLPDGDGLDMLSKWREARFNEPVLILSARDTLADRIRGLDQGADDYLQKPFSLEELLARIRALVRRQSTKKQTVLNHSGIQLDLLGHTVTVDGELRDLTSREYSLLEIFMQNHGRVLSRTLIAEKIWSSNSFVDTNLLEVYMSRLRNKLEAPCGKVFFKTVRGVGYKMV